MSAAEEMGIVVPRIKQPAKAICQVLTALKNSKNVKGPTMRDIVKFIFKALHKPATKRQIVTALKRGVDFGIIKRKKGHYVISSPEEDFVQLPETVVRKGRVARSREQPKLLDKVTKRSRALTKTRRGNFGRNFQNDYRISSMVSSTALHESDQDLHYS